MDNLKLLNLLKEMVYSSKYVDETGAVTFCNLFVYDVFKRLGCDYFLNKSRNAPMLANEIFDWLERNCPRHNINSELPKDKLVVFASKGHIHGHVCIGYPDGNHVYSAKWKMRVPYVANVGKINGIMGLNFAFHELPNGYIVNV